LVGWAQTRARLHTGAGCLEPEACYVVEVCQVNSSAISAGHGPSWGLLREAWHQPQA